MAGTNYVKVTVDLRNDITAMGIEDPVQLISRPGGGDPPRWHFTDGSVARGGAEAAAYLRGMLRGIQAMEGFQSDCC